METPILEEAKATEPGKESSSKTKVNIALVGNPNVGKSVVFNYLTGLYVDVSNYPGTTIEISQAALKLASNEQKGDYEFSVIDTPGVYGVSSFNDEEKATRDYVIDADLVVNVVSAITLERDLFLTKQLCDMGKPMILVINQIDEAKARKVEIDSKRLSEELGIPVLETVAIDGTGLNELKESILSESACPGKLSPEVELLLEPYLELVFSRAEALMILEGDEFIAARNEMELAEDHKEVREKTYQIRRKEVNRLSEKIIQVSEDSKRAIFGRLLLNPIFGSIVGLAVLYLFLYQFLGIFIAGSVVEITEGTIMNQYFEPMVRTLVAQVFPIIRGDASMNNLLLADPMAAIGTLLAGDYGVLTLTITYLYGLLLPLVLGFYFGLAVLEDSGYLPRLAVLVDGVLSKLGMNGRAIVPLILGGGCVTMAVVTTRLLGTRKEKLITMALLGLTIPCSAQLGVIQGLLSNLGGVQPWLIWGGTLFAIFVLVGFALNKVMPGAHGEFLTDIPPLRIPRMNNIWEKARARTKIFMLEATPAFFIAAALVACLQVTGLLTVVIDMVEPLISNVLLLPKETALSFILGMVRRDFGAFGLLEIQMTASQLITACLVLTLFVPCIATVAVTIKEGNFKSALAIWISSWLLAFGVGAIFARIL